MAYAMVSAWLSVFGQSLLRIRKKAAGACGERPRSQFCCSHWGRFTQVKLSRTVINQRGPPAPLFNKEWCMRAYIVGSSEMSPIFIVEPQRWKTPLISDGKGVKCQLTIGSFSLQSGTTPGGVPTGTRESHQLGSSKNQVDESLELCRCWGGGAY